MREGGIPDSKGLIGASVTRVEDQRFLTGKGEFTDDLAPDRLVRAVIVRSAVPNARLVSVETDAARALPGVLEILTGADLAADGLGWIKPELKFEQQDGSPMPMPARPFLNRSHVRYVGDPVACVVAETQAQAQEAADLVDVVYDPLPAVTDLDQVADGSAPAMRPDIADNRAFFVERGDAGAVDAAFARAAHVTRAEIRITPVQPSPLEPRAAIGMWDPETGRYTLIAGSQWPQRARRKIAGDVLNVEPEQVRVISPDMGGGFGNRSSVYAEQVLALWASRRLGRPVKWVSGRSESFLCDDQARDARTTAELALDADGTFLAFRVHTLYALGAYHTLISGGPGVNNLGGLAGVYRTPAIHVTVEGCFLNTLPTSAYRGAGRPEAIYVLERTVDQAARELGIDPVELRRRNIIPADAMPYKTGLAYTYDSGDFPGALDAALELADRAGFETRRTESRARGRLRGLGIACAVESASSPARPEHAEAVLDRDGCVRLAIGTHNHGQGHETVFAQVMGEVLGLPMDRLGFVQGDTDLVEQGGGTAGSRCSALGGGAAFSAATALVEKAKAIAAEELEAAAADIVFADGRFSVVGTDRAVDWTDVARAAGRGTAGHDVLSADIVYKPDGMTFPNGCHVCEVEIDPETGRLDLLRYLLVDDFGRVLNPMLLKGQVHGGLAQGIGQILLEQVVYEPDTGQLLTGSFLDYGMPRADDLPFFEVHTRPTKTTANVLGVKGAGEAGTVGAMPCVMNAILDAMAPVGVTSFDMPATPERVWRAIRDANGG